MLTQSEISYINQAVLDNHDNLFNLALNDFDNHPQGWFNPWGKTDEIREYLKSRCKVVVWQGFYTPRGLQFDNWLMDDEMQDCMYSSLQHAIECNVTKEPELITSESMKRMKKDTLYFFYTEVPVLMNKVEIVKQGAWFV
jgi:hypothetical protein